MADRREFLQAVGAGLGAVGAAQLAAALAPSVARAAEMGKMDAPAPSAADVELRHAAADCLRAGEGCIGHCTRELSAGNTAMAHCNAHTHEMVALVRALLALDSYDSPLAKRLAPLCADACKSCGEACAEHRAHWEHGMHLACKDCYEACQRCEKACRALS